MLEKSDSSETSQGGLDPYGEPSDSDEDRYPLEIDRSHNLNVTSSWPPVIRTTSFRTKFLVSTAVITQVILTGAIIASAG